MKSHPTRELSVRIARRALLVWSAAAMVGCTSPFLRTNTPEIEPVVAEDEENKTILVGDYAGASGLNYKKLETVGLVTNLDNTGSDPPPDAYRNYLMSEMQGRDVKKPGELLASPRTSLVLITAYLPPASQKGDALDVEIRIPTKSTTTSLRGGWLMSARLREMATVNTRILRGHEAGIAQGNVIVDSIFLGEKDKLNEVRGKVLGGAVSLEERKLGLVIRRDDVSIETTSVISAAVNSRFHTFDRGTKKGVAEAKNANFVELLVPARYRQNLGRFVNVVRAVPMRESQVQRVERLEALERKLLEPVTSARASIELEAIGREAIPVLKKGLAAPSLEVRFHAAEALAYLEVPDAAKVLTEAARNESAFRRAALSALSAMDHVQAYEGLTDLMHTISAETRYGAFRSLRLRNPRDPLVKGEAMRDSFFLHVIPSGTEPLIHISRTERPEIVLFGQDNHMREPQGLFAGKEIMLTSNDAEQVKISRFTPGEQDRVLFTSTAVEEVIRGIVELGGTYGDVIQALHEAKKAGNIVSRIAVDALPTADRTFQREDSGTEAIPSNSNDNNDNSVAKPNEQLDLASEIEESYVAPEYSPKTQKSVWSKMTDWMDSSKK